MATFKYKDPLTGRFISVPALQGAPGIGIDSVEQTYTATLPSEDNIITVKRNIGDSFNFKVKNGVGIVNIETLDENNISSAKNKYRIHLSDGTFKDVVLSNGVGISNIQQQNLADGPAEINNILITLSDGSTNTIQLRNGMAGGIQDVSESEIDGFITVVQQDGTLKEVSVGTALSIASNDSVTKSYVLTSTGSEDMELKYNTGVYVDCTSGVLFGAAWNDYAEFRDQSEFIKPGYVVYCDDDGKVKKTTEKLQKFEGVVSDTYGFSIGETDTCKTPLAVSGRVLVYADPKEEHFHSGDAVCAGPDGLIYRMTREEIMKFPDRIVGIVSEIPTYETWGLNNIKVNNRIWIKVR